MHTEAKDLLQKTQRVMKWNNRKLFYNIAKKHQRNWPVKRGEICFVDFGENIGSEENALRPCVVLQANSYNFSSPVFTCAIISNSPKTIPDIQISITGIYPYIDEKNNSRLLTGTVDLGQIKTIAKERIIRNIGKLKNELSEIDKKLFNAFGLAMVIKKRDNIINSLEGKVKYLQDKVK